MRTLCAGGFDPVHTRVESEPALAAALDRGSWEVILAAQPLAAFSASTALRTVRERGLDTPFIIISATADDELAVDAMRAGANDYLLKGALGRLSAAVDRELRESGARAAHRHALEQLRHNEARYRMLFESSPLPKWLFDSETLRFLEVNKAAIAHYGYSHAEFLRMTIRDLRPPEDVPLLLEKLQGGAGTSGSDGVWRHRKKDGTIIDVQLTSVGFPLAGRPARLVVAEDITRQRRSEQALKASEERFRAIFEQAAVGMAEIDPATGIFLRVNQKLCEISGYTGDELLRKKWTELIHPDEVAQVRERVQQVMGGDGRPLSRERRFLRKDGALLWGRVTASRSAHPQGGATLVAIVEDVTASHEAKEALLASERRVDTLLRVTLIGVLVVRLSDRRIVDVNEMLVEQLGWTREELIGHTTAELRLYARPDDFDRLWRELETTGKLAPMEARIRTKWGKERDFILTGARVDVNGEPCVIGAWHDITDLRRADAARRDTEERFRQLAEAVREVFWLTDPEKNQMLYISPAYERVWGRSGQRLQESPRDWVDAIHPDDRERVLKAALTQQPVGTYDEEYRIVRPDGTVRWIRDRASPVHDATGKVTRIAGVAEDITERRGLEDQLRQAQKMEAIGSLAGGVAHDFNNLLSIILAYAEMLGDQSAPDSPMRADLDQILRAGQRAADLTRQLLAFSRQQILQPRIVDLNEILAGMEKMLKRLIGEDVELVGMPSPSPALVNVDPGQMEQVIMNLAINARDAMPEGGRLTIEISSVTLDGAYVSGHANIKAGPHVMLGVSDTGIGMDAATQARAFEPFFTTKDQGKGTGLGLSTVFGIVRQSAGTIWLYSEPGKGTTFKIYLPVAGLAAGEQPQRLVQRDVRGTETILLVEDDPGVRTVVRSILHRAGYHVLEAENGGDALLISEQRTVPIDLLLTDVVMPRIGGAQLAARLVAQRPGLKVLYMSGYTDNAVVLHGVLHSEVAFVQKPITPAALLTRVRDVLEGPVPARREQAT